MSGTTVAVAREALYDLLVTSFAAESDVQIVYGPPEFYELDKVVGLVGQEPVGQREEWATLAASSNSAKAEEYAIDVGVQVVDSAAGNNADGAKAVDTEAWRIVEVIRAAVRASKGLGMNTAVPARNARSDVTGCIGLGTMPSQSGGWMCQINVVVTVYARIT